MVEGEELLVSSDDSTVEVAMRESEASAGGDDVEVGPEESL